jgi:hypothetical protein
MPAEKKVTYVHETGWLIAEYEVSNVQLRPGS